MMILLSDLGQVHLVCGKTDMRQGIDSLAYVVKTHFELDPFSGQVFLFCGGRIGVISVVEGGDEALAKQLSMHIAAMKPTVLSYKELDEQFVKDELAQLNHVIDQDNESRAMVNKPALPHLKYGSKAQLTDDVIAQAEADIKAELAAEGKPEKIWDKIIPGKMDRFMLDNTKVDQAYTLLAQVYIMDDSKTVEAYLESVNASVVEFARFEVGEGIEKAANDFEAEVAATMAAALNN
ncbi:translation elongation factor Ts [Streptococcus pneumoniae]|uniref:translation elongation factor Ts n=1 Tax=Streptococcus pneumoniae TaxID=1313 RepID=UPI0005E16F11|nr:translation elongation factor Ts [Streptococcus pneumoniae]COJ95707.1 elongation factor Ts [Streptococcus pneumoniae]